MAHSAEHDDDFDAFVRAERGAMLRYAALLCGSRTQAEDIVAEVLTRVYQRWGTLDPDAGRRAYLRRSLTNEFLSWRRRWGTRMIAYVEPDDLLDVADPTDRGRERSHDDALWACLATLPRRQRAAVVLRYYEDLTDTEIADTLGCRPASVRAYISKALATLRQLPETHTARESL